MADIRIRGEPTADPQVCKFVVDRSLHAGNVSFDSAAAAEGAPLAEALFTLPAVSAVTIARDTVTVTKQGEAEWPEIGKEIGKAIRAQITSGEPAVGDIAPAGGEELFERVQTVLTNEINPSIANHGGVVTLQRVEEGKAFVQMGGGCQGCGMADVTLKHGIESYLRQKVPEIQEVVDVTNHDQGENPYFEPGKGGGGGKAGGGGGGCSACGASK
ncbi:MAG: NifU family protein [Candidatus Thermoplasmatota archaeon]|nr:NifU family protein [Candidatus Thermoplasmatota archaeon]